MAAAVRYVRKRGSVFQYERRVPIAITRNPKAWDDNFASMKLWRRSLHTSVASEMFAMAEAAHSDFERRRKAALEQIGGAHTLQSPPTVSTIHRLKRAVTQFDLDMLEADRRRMESRHFEQLYLRANGGAESAEILSDLFSQYEIDASDRREAIITVGFEDPSRPWLPSPLRDAREAVDDLGLDAPVGSPAFGAIVAAVRRGYLAGAHDVSELMAGRARPRAAPSPTSSPKFSEAVEAYIAHKRLAHRTVRQIEVFRDEFIALSGDKPLGALTRSDFEAYVGLRAGRIVGGKDKDSIARPASASTVKKALGMLRSAIGHAIDHKDFKFDGPNPAVGIKIKTYVQQVDKAKMPDKRGFRVGELNRLLEHPWFTGCESTTRTHLPGNHRLSGAEYWAPMLAMFTGARVSELGGLRIAETRIDDPHPHFVIRDNEYRTTKKGYARCVPILDALIELGFGDYVVSLQGAGVDRLFPDWLPPRSSKGNDHAWYNSRLVKAFNRTVIPKQLGESMVNGARRDVTFHSFRGAFKAMLGSARYTLHPNIINEVIGHAKGELDQRYVGEIPIEETYPAIRECRYNDLVLPAPPPARLQAIAR